MIRRLPAAMLAAAALGALPPAQAADALSNSYWDAAYLNSQVEVGPASTDIEGFRLGAGIGLAKYLSFTGDYDQRRYRNGREGFGSAGFAGHTRHRVYQFHGALTYERIEGDDNTDSANDYVEDGYGVEVGARYAFPDVAVHAEYRYLDFGSLGGTGGAVDFTGSRYGVGADVQLSPWWSLVADYRVRAHQFDASGGSATVDYSEWTVGFRHYFATAADRLARHGGLLGGAAE
ncbi:MAG: hypothetical protein ACRETF_05875 [Nevskiaceae bacterium]